ncbi:MAG: hypothetical protein QME51_05585 [Planctomycetota bacterium]|nr:hypothetical protein [Planctomycetota bacterium]
MSTFTQLEVPAKSEGVPMSIGGTSNGVQHDLAERNRFNPLKLVVSPSFLGSHHPVRDRINSANLSSYYFNSPELPLFPENSALHTRQIRHSAGASPFGANLAKGGGLSH